MSATLSFSDCNWQAWRRVGSSQGNEGGRDGTEFYANASLAIQLPLLPNKLLTGLRGQRHLVFPGEIIYDHS
jgi:hypothetical protein